MEAVSIAKSAKSSAGWRMSTPVGTTGSKVRLVVTRALSANMFARTHLRLTTSPPLDARGTRPEGTFRELSRHEKAVTAAGRRGAGDPESGGGDRGRGAGDERREAP